MPILCSKSGLRKYSHVSSKFFPEITFHDFMILSDRKELNNPRKALHLMISMCFAALRPKVTIGELQVSCLSESVLPGPPGWGSRARPRGDARGPRKDLPQRRPGPRTRGHHEHAMDVGFRCCGAMLLPTYHRGFCISRFLHGFSSLVCPGRL